MADQRFVLDVGGEQQAVADADLRAILAGVASEDLEYAILSEEASGWFVQAIGAYGELSVEYQHQTPSGQRQHFRLCRSSLGDRGEIRRPPRVPGYEGYREKEVLSVEDGLAIFERFLADRDVPAELDRVDISAELGISS